MDERQLQALFARLDSMLQGVRQYIGARYVPRFVGTYDPTQSYEALDVVDNGSGTSYIAKIPTPANTPLTDTDHWFLYGSSSGAIINLQQQIDDMKDGDVPGSLQEQIDTNTSDITALGDLLQSIAVTPEMFGAVGDGVTDDSAAIEEASNHGVVYGGDNTYYIGSTIDVNNSMIGGNYKVKNGATIKETKDNSFIYNTHFYNESLPVPPDRGSWLLDIYHADNVHISHCTFNDACNALYLDHCKNTMVSENIFDDLRQTAPNDGGNGYGVLLIECDHIHIVNNIFHNVARHCVYISHEIDGSSDYNTNIFIADNTFMRDSNCVGNITGFEDTIMIRPAQNIYIENNIFNDMMSVFCINKQNITHNGVVITATSKNVYVRNNVGNFYNGYRTDGVFWMTSEDNNASCENIVISNNDFTYENIAFCKIGHVNNLVISANRIKSKNAATSAWLSFLYIPTAASVSNDIKNIIITDNDIEFNTNGNILMNFANALSTTDRGDFILKGNRIKNLLYIGATSAAYAYNRFEIIANDIDYVAAGTRNYFSSSTVVSFKVNKNAVNKVMGLYLARPTNIINTDAAFMVFGENSEQPPETVVGCMHIKGNTDTLEIKTPSGWFVCT